MNAPHPIWKKYPGLVWSNPDADDTVRIRVALTHPHFDLLLDLAHIFGLERLRQEWALVCTEDDIDVRRARPETERLLAQLAKGAALAAAGH